MSASVSLASLTDGEKDTTILVLAGYNKRLRKILGDGAARSPSLRRQLEELETEYGARLRFLTSVYTREIEAPQVVRLKAPRNDQIWRFAEAHG